MYNNYDCIGIKYTTICIYIIYIMCRCRTTERCFLIYNNISHHIKLYILFLCRYYTTQNGRRPDINY